MADVTGPISTLPGAVHGVPEGMTCDDHPDRPAVKRVQGETDSFGSEMIDMCQECYNKHLKHKDDPIFGTCDCCKVSQVQVFPRRSFEEGPAGRVYDYCKSCMEKEREYLKREFADDEDDRFLDEPQFYDDEDDDPPDEPPDYGDEEPDEDDR